MLVGLTPTNNCKLFFIILLLNLMLYKTLNLQLYDVCTGKFGEKSVHILWRPSAISEPGNLRGNVCQIMLNVKIHLRYRSNYVAIYCNIYEVVSHP